jgi:hypothetical protein
MGTVAHAALGLQRVAILMGAAPAVAQTASQCAALKYKAAGKYAQALAGCRAKTVAKGFPLVAPDCLLKAQAKLEQAFARAEKKSDCLATGDAGYATDEAQDFIATLPPILESRVRCCTLQAADQCTWTETEAECDAFPGGTLGPPGSFCDGPTGDCVAPPATPAPGFCCDGLAQGNGCVGNLDADTCTIAGGGAHSPSKLCMPYGSCEAP